MLDDDEAVGLARAINDLPIPGALPKLAAISVDPVGAWRREDAAAIHGLATLELRAAGVRPRR